MFQATGQICAASKRTYVHADVYDALRDELLSIARTMKIGNGLDTGVNIGPLQNEMQFKKVQCVPFPLSLRSMRTAGLMPVA